MYNSFFLLDSGFVSLSGELLTRVYQSISLSVRDFLNTCFNEFPIRTSTWPAWLNTCPICLRKATPNCLKVYSFKILDFWVKALCLLMYGFHGFFNNSLIFRLSSGVSCGLCNNLGKNFYSHDRFYWVCGHRLLYSLVYDTRYFSKLSCKHVLESGGFILLPSSHNF
jgi:hypothetical protein